MLKGRNVRLSNLLISPYGYRSRTQNKYSGPIHENKSVWHV